MQIAVSASTLMGQIAAGTAPVILDVRSRREYVNGHVPGAIHVPFWKISSESSKLSAFRDQPIVVYCGHGPRAMIAGASLRRRGFTNVAYLTGHMKTWRDKNFPVEVE
jgi:rhodanese-related sulfurtransferase